MGKLKVCGLHRCFRLIGLDDFSDRLTELEFLKRDGLSCGYGGKWVDKWHKNDKDAATALVIPCCTNRKSLAWCGACVVRLRAYGDAWQTLVFIQPAQRTNTCKRVNSGTPLCERNNMLASWRALKHTTRLSEWSHYCMFTPAIVCIPTIHSTCTSYFLHIH